MFVDQVKIYIKAGDGGDGMATFRREKYVPRGGPAGGDGGRGGNVILRADENISTLLDLRYRKHHRAENGENGGPNKRFGKDGEDLIIMVPLGTVVYDDDTDLPLADLTEAGQEVIIAQGGRGGRGNARFATSTQQAPTYAEHGEPGQERWLRLELKLLADVALAGFPNAGKSTLLARVSAARPKIADYPFTTLEPNLGVVQIDDHSFVMADIPGLIEGAHRGQGLGHEFLRHIERTRIIIHVVNAAAAWEGRDPLQDFYAINHELSAYMPELAQKPQIVALNKMDLPDAQSRAEELITALRGEGYQVFPISAATGQGIKPLLRATYALLQTAPLPKSIEIPEIQDIEDESLRVLVEDGVYVVHGKLVERRVAMTDLTNEEALYRLQYTLRRWGVFDALRAAGVQEGDTVRISDMEFDYVEDADPGTR